jgi:hypothetical protein
MVPKFGTFGINFAEGNPTPFNNGMFVCGTITNINFVPIAVRSAILLGLCSEKDPETAYPVGT